MKYLNKLIVFSLFMLMSFGGKIAAYTYTINNQTGQDVKVQLRRTGGKLNKKFDLIKENRERTFSIGGFKKFVCLSEIEVQTKEESGEWGKAKKARMVFRSGAPIGPVTHLVVSRTADYMSLCKNKSIDLRVNQKTGEIDANVR